MTPARHEPQDVRSVIDKGTMLLELGTGRTRPLRPTTSLSSSSHKLWDGVLIEEHSPSEWAADNVSLLNSAVFLTLDERAALQWRSGSRSVSKSIAPGQISILPAHHPHSARLRTAGRSIVVSLEQRILSCAAALLGEPGWVEPVWVHGTEDPLVRELVLALREEMGSGRNTNARLVQPLVAALAARIVRRYSTDRLQGIERSGGLSAPALQRTVRHIQEHLEEDLSLEGLAAVAGLSTCHFARMFKESTGFSPQGYVRNCRIIRAKQLLLNRSLSLAEVALQSGFCDQGHLTRCFRQLVGTTPGAFSRSLRGKS